MPRLPLPIQLSDADPRVALGSLPLEGSALLLNWAANTKYHRVRRACQEALGTNSHSDCCRYDPHRSATARLVTGDTFQIRLTGV